MVSGHRPARAAHADPCPPCCAFANPVAGGCRRLCGEDPEGGSRSGPPAQGWDLSHSSCLVLSCCPEPRPPWVPHCWEHGLHWGQHRSDVLGRPHPGFPPCTSLGARGKGGASDLQPRASPAWRTVWPTLLLLRGMKGFCESSRPHQGGSGPGHTGHPACRFPHRERSQQLLGPRARPHPDPGSPQASGTWSDPETRGTAKQESSGGPGLGLPETNLGGWGTAPCRRAGPMLPAPE